MNWIVNKISIILYMTLTIQAIIIGIVYVLSLLVGVFMAIKIGDFNAAIFILTILCFALIALLVYDTQCLTSGNCTTWSWIRTILYIIIPTIGLIIFFFEIFSRKPQQSSEEYTNSPVPMYRS